MFIVKFDLEFKISKVIPSFPHICQYVRLSANKKRAGMSKMSWPQKETMAVFTGPLKEIKNIGKGGLEGPSSVCLTGCKSSETDQKPT